MGPQTEATIPAPTASSDVERKNPLDLGGGGPKVPLRRPASDWFRAEVPPSPLRLSSWLFRSQGASVLWLIVRLWLGYQWINAGYQKIWGSEKIAFWYGGGAGVKGFASAGITGSATGKGGASYGWRAGFLHNFVIPNASWIARLISVAEIVIGIALVLGLFTGLAAFAGLSLNVIYMFSGSSGVNPMYAILSMLLILAWRNAGWFGLDRLVLRGSMRRLHLTQLLDKVLTAPPSELVPND